MKTEPNYRSGGWRRTKVGSVSSIYCCFGDIGRCFKHLPCKILKGRGRDGGRRHGDKLIIV